MHEVEENVVKKKKTKILIKINRDFCENSTFLCLFPKNWRNSVIKVIFIASFHLKYSFKVNGAFR